jgi:hypothetical protein
MVQSKSGLTQNDNIHGKFPPPSLTDPPLGLISLNQARDHISDRGLRTYLQENYDASREGYTGLKPVLTADQGRFTPTDERWVPKRSTFINLINRANLSGASTAFFLS